MFKGAIEARDPYETPAVDKARKRLLEEFAASVFQTRVGGDHKIRGPHGEVKNYIEIRCHTSETANVPNSRGKEDSMDKVNGRNHRRWEN